jgi:hypothetical protein
MVMEKGMLILSMWRCEKHCLTAESAESAEKIKLNPITPRPPRAAR